MTKTNMVYRAIITAAFLMLITTLESCVKGDTGATGQQGLAGANGLNGNANVVSSGVFSATSSDWGYSTTNGQYYVNLIDSALTTDVVNNGAVMVYKVNTDGSSTALPYNNGNGYYNDYTLLPNVYEVQIQIGLVTGATPSNPGNQEYRIVVIPSSQRKASPNLNLSDYNEVKATFGNNVIETSLKTH